MIRVSCSSIKYHYGLVLDTDGTMDTIYIARERSQAKEMAGDFTFLKNFSYLGYIFFSYRLRGVRGLYFLS